MTKTKRAGIVGLVGLLAAVGGWSTVPSVHAQTSSDGYESRQLGDYSPGPEIPVAALGQDDAIVGCVKFEDLYAPPPNIMLINAQGDITAPASVPVYQCGSTLLIGVVGNDGFVGL